MREGTVRGWSLQYSGFPPDATDLGMSMSKPKLVVDSFTETGSGALSESIATIFQLWPA